MKRLTDLIGSVFGYDNVGVAGELFFRLFVQKLRAACEIAPKLHARQFPVQLRCFSGARSVAPAAHYPTALRQLAWTVAHLREHAAEYHIDPNKVVVAGFSAGGHLAASYGVFWKKKTFLAEELGVDAEQLRPNGLLLSYPVITSGPKAHRGSFTKLLGDRYDELVDEMSLENQVSLDTPKTFLWHTAPDDCVPVENSILFFTALHALEIPVEMHIYPVGGHGLGLASEETQSYEYQNAVREECQSWISLALSWMQHL